MQISPFPFSLFFFFFFSFLIHMAWRHRMQGTEIGFFSFLSKRHVANWETSILIRWICWQGKEGVSETLCLLEGVVLMGRHRRVRWRLPFFVHGFSSLLKWTLWLFKIIWRFRPGTFAFRAAWWVDGWRGLSWCWEGLSSKKKKAIYAYVHWQKWKPFLALFFLVFILIPFLQNGPGLSSGEIIEKQQVRRRRSFRSWGTRPILTCSFHLKYRLRIVLN